MEPLASYGSLTGYVKKIRAKELWDTIIESNWKSAEPGILFWDNIIDYDPASVYQNIKLYQQIHAVRYLLVPMMPVD